MRLKGTLRPPGDKSISHRALIFSTLTSGKCTISGLSPAEDCASTASCLMKLGIKISHPAKDEIILESIGLPGLIAPGAVLDAGNSGTTMRLLAGLVSGRNFRTPFDGDESLRQRPMARVLKPLQSMGAQIDWLEPAPGGQRRDGYAPFAITGGELIGQEFDLPIASAQVETALVLAGLQAVGTTTVVVPKLVRDHTRRMLTHMELPLQFAKEEQGYVTTITNLKESLRPFEMTVPADISSAAFFMVAAALIPGSDITLRDIGVNPGRDLVICVLSEMGADIELLNTRSECGEPVADIRVKGGNRLKGVTVGAATIARGIDEIPILSLAGAFCDGTFTVTDADELRVKESDRLTAIVENLGAAGVEIVELDNGFEIQGKIRVTGGSRWRTYKDHRLSMTGMVAQLLFDQAIDLEERASVKISYPSFETDLQSLVKTP